MDKNLFEQLKTLVKDSVSEDGQTLTSFSHDASIFEINPQAVVFPKDYTDVENVVKFVNKHKKEFPNLSVTGRSAGTDMGGGPLSESIILSFTQHLNNISGIKGNVATTQPGVYYRDFEKFTLQSGLIFPSYPASREICAMGGIVNNNSGGEKSLQYGKTEKYVKRVKVVLSDGSVAEFKPLNERRKRGSKNF